MKRLFTILLFLTSLYFTGFSQRFNAGLMAGGIVSQVDGDTWQGYHKFGFLFGGVVSLKVSPHSSFQMELEFIQKGSRKNADSTGNDLNTYLLRLNYIEVPILYQYYITSRFSLEAGPVMDVLVGSKEMTNGLEVNAGITGYVPLKPITFSGIFGASYDITDHLRVNFRFNYSLMSIRNGTANGYRKIVLELGQYNNVMALSMIYFFKEN
ncbi:MAG: porin family protein [Bacteroidetes bacterium]|nr:porin family protein [Bacteroidota bacterium]